MTIRKRLIRSNLIMLIVPFLIAGILLTIGLGGAVLLLQEVYLPRLGLTLQDLHRTDEELESLFSGLKLFTGLYLGITVLALLAAVFFTNLYLTKALFVHIRAYTEALLDGIAVSPESQNRYLQTIYKRETELEGLINRLFELVKLGTGEEPVHIVSLSRRDSIDAMIGNVKKEEGSSLLFSNKVSPDVFIPADPDLLARILNNLAGNSRKYGAASMTFSAQVSGSRVLLSVSDDGPGVAAGQLPHIFDPFYRGDASRTSPGNGSGLGLAIVRRAMNRMNGGAAAEPAAGHGLTIVLTFPTGSAAGTAPMLSPDESRLPVPLKFQS